MKNICFYRRTTLAILLSVSLALGAAPARTQDMPVLLPLDLLRPSGVPVLDRRAGLALNGDIGWTGMGEAIDLLRAEAELPPTADPALLDSLLRQAPALVALGPDSVIEALQEDDALRLRLYLDYFWMVIGEPDFQNLPGLNVSPDLVASGALTGPGLPPGLCGGEGQLSCIHPVWRADLRAATAVLVVGDAHRAAVETGGGLRFPLTRTIASAAFGGHPACAPITEALGFLADWAAQPVLGTCSGVMAEVPGLGPGFLTAGHCLVNGTKSKLATSPIEPRGATLVFDFTLDNMPADAAQGFLSRRALRLAADEAVYVPADSTVDLAFVPIPRDRLPAGVAVVALTPPPAVPPVLTEVFSLGFPLGAPLKGVAGSENRIAALTPQGFVSTLDNFNKSSGSPVFGLDGALVGIFVRVGLEGTTDISFADNCAAPAAFDAAGLANRDLPGVMATAQLAAPLRRLTP